MAAIGPILGAVGSIFSGVVAMSQANYQAEIAKMNASIADDNAKRAIDRSQVEQQDQDAKSLALLGQQEAIQSASGVSLSSGSSVLTRKSARELARKDALNIRQGGEIEAYNYKVEASNQRAQAQLDTMGGQGSLLSGFFGAAQGFSSLVSSSPSVASPYRYTPRPMPKPMLLT